MQDNGPGASLWGGGRGTVPWGLGRRITGAWGPGHGQPATFSVSWIFLKDLALF